MNVYVMSDIHGCYDEFQRMMDKISFSDADQMILAGDYIDKGTQNYEMLKWIGSCPSNVRLICGNHEEEFAAYVDLMNQIDQIEHMGTDAASYKDTVKLYQTVQYFLQASGLPASYFDAYHTMRSLVEEFGMTMVDFCGLAAYIREMPYYMKLQIEGKNYLVVHAGYVESSAGLSTKYAGLEQFYLYAREDSCTIGGARDSVIIAGHTPTVAEGEFAYNEGNVFRYYDKERNCTFYDIDCGCAYRGQSAEAKLACIRLGDEKIFYV